MFKSVMHLLMLSCRRANLLSEKKRHTKLSALEAAQLKMHLSMCALCRDSKVKSDTMHQIMQGRGYTKGNFTPQEVEEIKSKIKDNMNL